MDRNERLNWEKRLLLVAVLVAGIMVTAILLWPHKKSPSQTTNRATIPLVIATPKSYTDFYGQVAEVSSTLFLVRMEVTSETGQAGTKSYRVLIGRDTIVKEQVDALTGPVYKPLKITDFRVGDRVHVFGSENLYALSQFTATKFYLLR